ncbi:MAG: Cytochrome C biogenesis protein transmembrane region [bacterium ADurb.Bin400]|nr:MAG: Cytochrome C biogenesis protein transmembrane region [bacterium ADurb.Bin400]
MSMDALTTVSMVAAFIAGIAALLAPCCVTVLLPSYLASVFREKKTVFVMTFIFFLGILTVFLPLGLGSAAFGQFLDTYHNTIFIFGGGFMLFLGFSILLGKKFSFHPNINPALKSYDVFSIYVLGILSGIATTCCAPVLAGVLALAALPGSMFWGVMYTLSYVLGMVLPLFIIAAFLDRYDFSRKLRALRRPVIRWFNRGITIGDLISGITFVLIGLLIIYLAFHNKLITHSDYQSSVNIYSGRIAVAIKSITQSVPEYLWVVVLAGLLLFLVISVVKKHRIDRYDNHQSIDCD